MKAKKNLIVIGDKVLIDLDEKHDRTNAGLYLPPTVTEKEKVQGGYVVKVGPGYPLADSSALPDEPWITRKKKELKYLPLQAVEGDYALFLKDSAIEIEFEGRKYLIVPHVSILALVRTELVEEPERFA